MKMHIFRRLLGKTATAVAITLLTMVGSSIPTDAQQYRFTDQDPFNFVTSDGSVQAAGAVNWFAGDLRFRPDVIRGELAHLSWVLLRRAGCAHVKLTWNVIGYDISLPPAATLSREGISNGYYIKCGPAGTWMNITGMAYYTARMTGATIEIGYSQSRGLPRRYDAAYKMKVNGK